MNRYLVTIRGGTFCWSCWVRVAQTAGLELAGSPIRYEATLMFFVDAERPADIRAALQPLICGHAQVRLEPERTWDQVVPVIREH